MRIGVGIACLALASCSRCRDEKTSSTSSVAGISATVAKPAPVAFSPGALAEADVRITLTNTSDKPITLSKFAGPNVSVTSVTCTGETPTTFDGLVVGFALPSEYARASIEELAPNASVDIETDGVRTVTETVEGVVERRWMLTKRGTCTVRMRYQYTGPDAGNANVMRGAIDLPPMEVVIR